MQFPAKKIFGDETFYYTIAERTQKAAKNQAAWFQDMYPGIKYRIVHMSETARKSGPLTGPKYQERWVLYLNKKLYK